MSTSLKIAEAQADQIYDHWHGLGYEIQALVVVSRSPRGVPEYAVRTNLVAGLPAGVCPRDLPRDPAESSEPADPDAGTSRGYFGSRT